MNLGLRTVLVPDATQDTQIPVYLLYATDEAATPHTFGPHTIDVADDAKPHFDTMPVVVISHGMQGTPWGYRGLAAHLALAGYQVALVEHPGDSRRDGGLAGTAQNLVNRPRHVRLVLDALGADRAAIIGHSMGGYTALAVSGGQPMALPNQTPDGTAHPVAVDHDPRICCAILLAPAIPWLLAPGALDGVRIPVMVRVGEQDTETPPFFVHSIVKGLAQLDYAVVPGAGHFAFFYPVSPALQRLPPGQDPTGFDRSAYQPQLVREITSFLSAASCTR